MRFVITFALQKSFHPQSSHGNKSSTMDPAVEKEKKDLPPTLLSGHNVTAALHRRPLPPKQKRAISSEHESQKADFESNPQARFRLHARAEKSRLTALTHCRNRNAQDSDEETNL